MPDHYVAISSDNGYESYSVPCLICGKDVKLTDNEKFGTIGGIFAVKVCQKCKDAVEWAAKEMPLICGREYNKNNG